MIVYDISGHPSRAGDADFLAELTAITGSPVTYRHSGPWDVGNPTSGDELRDAVVDLLRPVLNDTPAGERAAFVVPGFSPSVAMFLALYHGQQGHFPLLIWIIRDEDGAWTKPVLLDLDDARAWSRSHLRFQEDGS